MNLIHTLQRQLLFSTLVLSACAFNPDKFDNSTHGLVFGEVGFTVSGEEAVTVREIKLSVKQQDGFLSLLEIYVTEDNNETFFVTSLKPGTYHFTNLVIRSAGVQLTSEEEFVLPFTVTQGKASNIGLLLIELNASQTTFAFTLDRKAIINTYNRQKKQTSTLYDMYPQLHPLPVVYQPIDTLFVTLDQSPN